MLEFSLWFFLFCSIYFVNEDFVFLRFKSRASLQFWVGGRGMQWIRAHTFISEGLWRSDDLVMVSDGRVGMLFKAGPTTMVPGPTLTGTNIITKV